MQIKWAIISNLVMDQTHWIMFERKGNCNWPQLHLLLAPTNVRKDYLILSLPLHLILTPSNPSPLHLGRKPPSPQTDSSSHHYLIVQPLLVIKFEHNTATTVAHRSQLQIREHVTFISPATIMSKHHNIAATSPLDSCTPTIIKFVLAEEEE